MKKPATHSLQPTATRVIGIDPGYERVGVAVVEKLPKEKERLIFSDCIRTKKTDPHPARLATIATTLTEVIKEYRPGALAIETLFFNTNQTTAMHVAEARGVMLALGALNGISVEEYTPLQIKIAISGYGRADKKQMMAMIPKLISIKKGKMLDDEYDAIAVALTSLATKSR